MTEKIKEHIKEVESKLDTDFKKHQFYSMAEAHNEQINRESNICPDKYYVEFMIDNSNAIIKSDYKFYQNAPYSAVVDGKPTNESYRTVEEAMLGWMGVKHLGRNSHFSYMAYKMLVGKVE